MDGQMPLGDAAGLTRITRFEYVAKHDLQSFIFAARCKSGGFAVNSHIDAI